MAERQSLVWLRQLLPPQLPRSVLLTVPRRQPHPQTQTQHSIGADKAAAAAVKLVPVQASGLQPQQVLRFQLSSELVQFNTELSRAPLCPCHGLPVQRLPMAAGSKGTAGPHRWSALNARSYMRHQTSVFCGAVRTGTS